MKELVESYNQYVSIVEKGSLAIAEHLRNDELGQAFQMIQDFSEGMSWLEDAKQVLHNNNVIVSINFEDIQEFLVEINEGLEVQDYVLVADLFEYEIAPFFAQQSPIELPAN